VLRLALGFLAACSAPPALAQTEHYIAVEDRVVEPARPIAVIIPQEELATSLELGRIAPIEGGLIGALIDKRPEKLAQGAAAKAYGFAAPLNQAIADFDARPLALAATQQALSQAEWFAVSTPDVLSGASMAKTAGTPDANGGDTTVNMTYSTGAFGSEPNETVGARTWKRERDRLESGYAAAHPEATEIAVVTWRYQLSPDFTNIRVIADVATRRPQDPSRLYEQQVLSIVKLRRPSFVEEENVAKWAANDGALARKALEMAFARVGEVLPAILALDEQGYDGATDKKKGPAVTAAGFQGPELMRDAKGPVFYSRDGDQRLRAFVTVQTLAN